MNVARSFLIRLVPFPPRRAASPVLPYHPPTVRAFEPVGPSADVAFHRLTIMEHQVTERRASGPRTRAFTPSGPQIALIQAVYYLITGVWPLLDMRTFEAITGPKVDRWLVKTVGVLVAAVGGSLGLAARAGRTPRETAFLGAACAGGLTAIDVVYVSKRRISPIYLLDAAAELLFLAAWARTRPWHRPSL